MTFRYRPRPGQRVDDIEPALRDVTFTIEPGTARRRGRGHRVGQDHAGQAAHPPRRPRRRARSASPASTCATSAMASLRSTLVMVPQDAVPVRHHHRRQRPLRPARAPPTTRCMLAFTELGLDDWLDALPDGLRPGSASGASTSRPASASSSPWPGPTSPTRRAWCWTRPPRPSTPPPRPALARALDSLARGPHVGHDRPPAVDRRPGRLDPRVRPRPPGRAGPHDELLAHGGVYAGLYASWLDATTANDGLPVPLG